MKTLIKLAVLCALMLTGVSAPAQISWFPVIGTGNPTGACGASQIYLDQSTGNEWTCKVTAGVGAWQQVGGTAGTVTRISTAGPNLSGGPITTSGTISTTSNILPAVVTVSTQTTGGNVTSLAVTPPSSIVNGNALWMYIGVAGRSSETWTPPAGWTQVGSTLTSSGLTGAATAKFCKVAASESGNYTISWNNSSTNGVFAQILQVRGSDCSIDGSGSQASKATNLTVNGFSTTNSNDLLLVTNFSPSNVALLIDTPLNTVLQSPGNREAIYTLGWGNGTTPSVKAEQFAAGSLFSEDFTLEVTAIAPVTTSSTVPFVVQNGSATLASIDVSGGGNFGGNVGANQFVVPCSNSINPTQPTSPGPSFSARRNDGSLVSLLGVACSTGAEVIDSGEFAGNINTGSGTTGGANILITSGFVDFISRDSSAGSQDLNVLTLSTAVTGDSLNATSNNLIIGCLIEPCSGGTILGDVILRAQPTKAVRIANGVTDELWVNGSGFVGGVPVVAVATPAAPTVTPTCSGTCASTWSYAVDCLDANGSTTLVSSNGTTAANASTLDGTHFNTITWSKTIGCKTYEIRRTAVATSPATTGLIGTNASGLALSFVDNNVAGDSSAAPTVNTTGGINAVSLKANGVSVPGILCSNVTPVTVNANTTADQNLMSCTIAANALNSANRVMQVQVFGAYSTPAASTSTITLKAKLCSVSGCGSGTVLTLFSATSTALAALQATNNPWNVIMVSTTQTAGASAAFESHGTMTLDLAALASASEAVFADNSTATIGTIDSTAQLFLQITIAFSNASGSNSATQRQGVESTLN